MGGVPVTHDHAVIAGSTGFGDQAFGHVVLYCNRVAVYGVAYSAAAPAEVGIHVTEGQLAYLLGGWHFNCAVGTLIHPGVLHAGFAAKHARGGGGLLAVGEHR